MPIKKLLAVFLFLSCAHAHAQKASAPATKPSFHAIGYVGLLEGSKSSSFQLQLINGFGYKGWYAGMGAGLDYYFIRTIPVTAYVERTLAQDVPLFVYGSAGVHFVWNREIGDDLLPNGNSKYNNGLFYDAGFGYRFDMAKNASIRVSIGYSEKQIRETRELINHWTWPGQPSTTTEIYNYQLQRVSIRAGFQF